MALEIERKFLVRGEFMHLAVKQIEISQGYLSVDRDRIVRIRIVDERAILTINSPTSGTDFSRHALEYENSYD